jgi:uncharacterized protein (UPF0264 family)
MTNRGTGSVAKAGPIASSGGVCGRTGTLVSVRSLAEAQAAIDGGVDILDIKEPNEGPLGAASPTVWREISQLVAGRPEICWSVAMGELSSSAPSPTEHGLEPAFAKVGLAMEAENAAWRQDWKAWKLTLAKPTEAVAVVYADFTLARAPAPLDVIEAGALLGCTVLLIDTFGKQNGGLLQNVALTELAFWCDAARSRSMKLAIAGSLTSADVPRVSTLRPDWLAVRGAVCRGPRNGPVDASKVREFVSAVRNSQ